MSDSKEVANYKERMAAHAKAVQEEETPSVVNLSLAGGQMSIMEQALPDNRLEAVILTIGTERTWYDRPFDADDRSPPDCYANKIGNDNPFQSALIPAANVPNPPAEKCLDCPQGKLGSAANGKGAACKSRRKLVLAPASVLDNPESLGKSIVVASVPPTSTKNFSQYVMKLSSQGLPPFGVVTELHYKPSKRTLHEMTFEAVQPVKPDNPLLGRIIDGLDREEWNGLVLTEYSYEEEEEAPQGKGGKRKY